MKKYANIILRKGKTDKLDAIKIANYGLDNWFHLTNYESVKKSIATTFLGRQYAHYINYRINANYP